MSQHTPIFTHWVDPTPGLKFPAEVHIEFRNNVAVIAVQGSERDLGGKAFAGHRVNVALPLATFAEMIGQIVEGMDRLIGGLDEEVEA